MDLQQLMNPILITIAVVVTLVITVLLVWLYLRKRRNATAELRKRFGIEAASGSS